MLDDAYDGSNFVVRQVIFCGGDKDEFDQWKKELSNLAAAAAKKKAEQTLKLQIDDEAFASAYGHISRPFPFKPGQKVAVRVVSQFGEETTKVNLDLAIQLNIHLQNKLAQEPLGQILRVEYFLQLQQKLTVLCGLGVPIVMDN
jgi:hypothetical protein